MGTDRSETKTTDDAIALTESANTSVRKHSVCCQHSKVGSGDTVVRENDATNRLSIHVQDTNRTQNLQVTAPRSTARTHEEWVEIFLSKHGQLYQYASTSNPKFVEVFCAKHNTTSIVQRSNLRLHGTKCCRNEMLRDKYKTSQEDFINKARQIHGDKYDYTNVSYVNTHTKVSIVCPIHGTFTPTPLNHLQGSGCRACANAKADYRVGGYTKRRFATHPEIKSKPARLYVIKTTGCETFVKIGITEKDVDYRFRAKSIFPYNYDTVMEIAGPLYDMFLLEQHIKQRFKQYQHRPQSKFNGHTECFDVSVLNDMVDFCRGVTMQQVSRI